MLFQEFSMRGLEIKMLHAHLVQLLLDRLSSPAKTSLQCPKGYGGGIAASQQGVQFLTNATSCQGIVRTTKVLEEKRRVEQIVRPGCE